MSELERFTDNGDGTITDSQLNLMWKKNDSFQDTNKWINWFKSNKYAENLNKERFAGHSNWRLPSEDEAWSLFDMSKKLHFHYSKQGNFSQIPSYNVTDVYKFEPE